ncbi:MAG: hypothetical protein ACOC7N_03410 [Chloroflexota bacterium]
MKSTVILRLLGMGAVALLLAACGQPMTPSRRAESQRTLPPTVDIEPSPGTVVSRLATLDSPEQAQELVSFPVLVSDPESLPAELTLEGVGWQLSPEKNTEFVALQYRDA